VAMPVGGAAGTIVECNWSGSKTRQRARRLRGYSGPFASGHPMSVLLPKGGMPRVAAECAIVRPIKFGALGRKQTFAPQKDMSALPQKRTFRAPNLMSALCK
jgi:hypothetical protein